MASPRPWIPFVVMAALITSVATSLVGLLLAGSVAGPRPASSVASVARARATSADASIVLTMVQLTDEPGLDRDVDVSWVRSAMHAFDRRGARRVWTRTDAVRVGDLVSFDLDEHRVLRVTLLDPVPDTRLRLQLLRNGKPRIVTTIRLREGTAFGLFRPDERGRMLFVDVHGPDPDGAR